MTTLPLTFSDVDEQPATDEPCPHSVRMRETPGTHGLAGLLVCALPSGHRQAHQLRPAKN